MVQQALELNPPRLAPGPRSVRAAEPVDDPIIHRHLDEPPAIAVAADDTSGLQYLGESDLGGATEIDHGRASIAGPP